MLDISAVVSTRDRPEELRLCLNALEAQTLAPSRWEIVVVDDGSRDDAASAVVRTYGGRAACRLVEIPPAGPAAARNAGAKAALARRALFLLDDVVADPELLAEHLAAAERRPGTVIVGFHEEADPMPSEAFRAWWSHQHYQNRRGAHDPVIACFHASSLSVERQDLLDAGGFDENFTCAGWENLDLGLRLERRGTKIVFHARARTSRHLPSDRLQALCRRECDLGFSAPYFFETWRDERRVQEFRFWEGDPAAVRSGPAWRKALGRALIAAAEGLRLGEPLLRVLYARLVASCRYEGLREGAARAAAPRKRASL
jgi:glycosyltransferase involved in cell wall biosynthesis